MDLKVSWAALVGADGRQIAEFRNGTELRHARRPSRRWMLKVRLPLREGFDYVRAEGGLYLVPSEEAAALGGESDAAWAEHEFWMARHSTQSPGFQGFFRARLQQLAALCGFPGVAAVAKGLQVLEAVLAARPTRDDVIDVSRRPAAQPAEGLPGQHQFPEPLPAPPVASPVSAGTLLARRAVHTPARHPRRPVRPPDSRHIESRTRSAVRP